MYGSKGHNPSPTLHLWRSTDARGDARYTAKQPEESNKTRQKPKRHNPQKQHLHTMRSLAALVSACLVFQSLLVQPSYASSAAGTETLVGIVGRDFVLLGADSSISQSIALTASNLDKIAVISDPFPSGRSASRDVSESDYQQQTIAVAAAGDAADTDRLLSILTAHANIREYEASVGCDVQVSDFSKLDSATTTSATTTTSSTTSPAGLSVEAAARLARSQIASQLRSRTPLRVCLLVAGMMPTTGLAESSSSILNTETGLSSYTSELQQQVVGASAPYLLAKSASGQVVATPDVKELTTCSLSKLRPYLYWLDEYGSLQKLQYGAHGHGSNFILSILDQGYRPDLTRQQAQDLMRECFAQLRMRYVINSPQQPCIKCVDAEGCRLLLQS